MDELNKKEYMYKVLVIGDSWTGKTSIIKRYVHNFFDSNYKATLGADFALKTIKWDDTTLIRLHFWDIAGQERFHDMRRVYYKEAVGCLIVYDITCPQTFHSVEKWKNDLDSKLALPDGQPIPCVLIANKCDEKKSSLLPDASSTEEYWTRKGFAGFFETSAKKNVHIEEACRFLVCKIIENEERDNLKTHVPDDGRFQLASNFEARKDLGKVKANRNRSNCCS